MPQTELLILTCSIFSVPYISKCHHQILRSKLSLCLTQKIQFTANPIKSLDSTFKMCPPQQLVSQFTIPDLLIDLLAFTLFPTTVCSLNSIRRNLFIFNIYLFIWLCQILVVTCGILFPDQRSKLGSAVLVTGSPEKSHGIFLKRKSNYALPSWQLYICFLSYSHSKLETLQRPTESYTIWPLATSPVSLLSLTLRPSHTGLCFSLDTHVHPPQDLCLCGFYCFQYQHSSCILFWFCKCHSFTESFPDHLI